MPTKYCPPNVPMRVYEVDFQVDRDCKTCKKHLKSLEKNPNQLIVLKPDHHTPLLHHIVALKKMPDQGPAGKDEIWVPLKVKL